MIFPVLPAYQTRFADPRTGENSREWYRYLAGLLGGAVIQAAGNATLVAGTATVNTAFADGDNEFLLTVKQAGGTQGFLSIGTIVVNTSFVINSSNAADTSTVSWVILKAIV